MEYHLEFPATSISGVDLVHYDQIQSENGSQDERCGDGGVPKHFSHAPQHGRAISCSSLSPPNHFVVEEDARETDRLPVAT